MKTLLAPTDFSETSANAVEYAISLARNLSGRIILYHTYHLPVVTAEMPVMPLSTSELEDSSLQRLQMFRNELLGSSAAGLDIECLTTPGFAVDEITELAAEHQADLVVMGISGTGKLEHALLGSVTTGVLKQITAPLFIIPDTARYRPIKNIAFACDYKKPLSQPTLKALHALISAFGAKLLVVNVDIFDEHGAGHKSLSEIMPGDMLADVPHEVFTSVSTNIPEAIKEFNENHQIDLLVMVPRHHSFFQRLFSSGNTEKMASHSNIPILALHE